MNEETYEKRLRDGTLPIILYNFKPRLLSKIISVSKIIILSVIIGPAALITVLCRSINFNRNMDEKV